MADETAWCDQCHCRVDAERIFYCPKHGSFHNGQASPANKVLRREVSNYCGWHRTRVDGVSQVSCPVCGFMPCGWCRGKGKPEWSKGEPCRNCGGSGMAPFQLYYRKNRAADGPTFAQQMYRQAQGHALRCGIRYLMISHGNSHWPKQDYISFTDARYFGRFSYSLPLFPEQRRRLYGWLMKFKDGGHRRFAYTWERLLDFREGPVES